MKTNVKMRISTQASCVDDDGIIWIFSNDCNALFSWKSGELKYVTSFDDEIFFEDGLYNKALNCGDNIFFFPVRAKKIACYSKLVKQVTYVDIPERKKDEYFNVICGNESQVWLFPVFKRNYAYVFDMTQKTIQKCTIHWNNMDLDEKNSLIGDAILGKHLYMAVSGTNFILKFNIENYKCEKIEVTEPIFRTHRYGKFLYALNAFGNAILQYREERLEIAEICYERELKKKGKGFLDMEFADFFSISSDSMILLPMQSKGAYIVFKGGEKAIVTWQSGCQLYDDILRYQDTIYLMPYKGDAMIILSADTFDYTVVQLEINQEDYWKRMSQEIKKNKVLLNEGLVSLENFMMGLN